MTSIETIIIIIFIIVVGLFFINFILKIDNFDNTSSIADKLINLKILKNDLEYYKKFNKLNNTNKFNQLINNNKLTNVSKRKNKILFVTFDNRSGEKYLKMHNSNINSYAKKFGYEYKFFDYCPHNVYWCKIYLVLDLLKSNKYDYVVWLDSDTIIKNFTIDIGKIFNAFNSDIFIGSDNNKNYNLINSGIFAISNTIIGINFLSDCINHFNKDCMKLDGSLRGKWAATCYEQGIMNILINDKYYPKTTILTNEIFFNNNNCSNEVFIMHLYASSPESRTKCFESK